ncbi:MAG: arginase family protein, partial [Myxococcota bacterium]
RAVLGGTLPVGIGGDHSMAAASIRATVLGEATNAIVDGTLSLEPRYGGDSLRREFAEARTEANPMRLGALLERCVASGALHPRRWAAFRQSFQVLWFDAHMDINTPGRHLGMSAFAQLTPPEIANSGFGPLWLANSPSVSGNLHGMPLSFATRLAPDDPWCTFTNYGTPLASIHPARVTYVLPRDTDPSEVVLAQTLGIRVITMDEISGGSKEAQAAKLCSAIGAEVRRHQAMVQRCSNGAPSRWRILIQLDVDVLNAEYVPLTGTPVGCGSTRNSTVGPGPDVLIPALYRAALDPCVRLVDVVEFAFDEKKNRDNGLTVKSGLSLVDALFGRNQPPPPGCPRIWNPARL